MTTSLSKLFVGGLSWGTVDSALFDEFAKYGPLDEAIVVRDKITGRSRGFGFVRFQNPEDAQRAKDATDGNPIDGRVVRVDFASEKRRPPVGISAYDGMPFQGNSSGLSMQQNYMGGFPQQAYMQHAQPYGYQQYGQPNMNSMYGMMPQGQMQMPQMYPPHIQQRQMNYPSHGPAQSPPAGFDPNGSYGTSE